MKMPGVEAAARPLLYPHSAFVDTDLRDRLRALGLSTSKQHLSIRDSFLHKALSRCRACSEDFMLAFLLYDIHKAHQIVSVANVAEKKKLSAEAIADHYVGSESYWRHEQDILCDVVRITHALGLQHDALYCSNVFITITAAEDKVPLHDPFFGVYWSNMRKGDCTGPMCLHIDSAFKRLLLPTLERHFEKIYEWWNSKAEARNTSISLCGQS